MILTDPSCTSLNKTWIQSGFLFCKSSKFEIQTTPCYFLVMVRLRTLSLIRCCRDGKLISSNIYFDNYRPSQRKWVKMYIFVKLYIRIVELICLIIEVNKVFSALRLNMFQSVINSLFLSTPGYTLSLVNFRLFFTLLSNQSSLS